jgi:hypothetical protein
MGEARRKPLFAGELFAIPCSNSCTRSIVYCVLTIIANTLDAQLFIKEPGDDLLEWPVNSFIGATPYIETACRCPGIVDIKRRPPPNDHFEFVVPNLPLIAAYCLVAESQNLPFPNPVHPKDFPLLAREVMREQNTDGWCSIIPTRWGERLTPHCGEALN